METNAAQLGDTKLTFKRYEKKYLLTRPGYEALMERLAPRIEPDEYPESTVCSLYYDTEDYRLIRHSLEGPIYKEKLRLRSYGVPDGEGTVFVELKKKYQGIVYKRRVPMGALQAEAWLNHGAPPPQDSQMAREIQWFLTCNRPVPKALIACDRSAWRAVEEPELRITFDRDIRWRDTELSLRAGSLGAPVLPEDRLLMEIKIPGAAPLWLAHLLSDQALFPQSFSKYGSCYTQHILPDYVNGVIFHA